MSSVVRALAPTCYLCGVAPSEHAEHVQPLARGGRDEWDNVGGACATCNAVKGDRVLTLTLDQSTRLAAQQTAFRAAYDRVTPGLVVEALATRARRKAAPTGDAEGDQDDALFRMRLLLFDGTGVSPDDGGSWLEAAVNLMQSRGWLKPVPGWPVPEAVADHLGFERDDDPDGWRYEGGMATRRVPGAP